jgi:dystonin
VERNVAEVDTAWQAVSDGWMSRLRQLDDAMKQATGFQEQLIQMLGWLADAEDRLDGMGLIASETDTVKEQIEQLKALSADVQSRQEAVQSLVHTADGVAKDAPSDQAAAILDPVRDISRRWEGLSQAVAQRMGKLQKTLIDLGHFHPVVHELFSWLGESEGALGAPLPLHSDPRTIEAELAKLKVLKMELHNRQPVVDSILEAGRAVIQSEGGAKATETRTKLEAMNRALESIRAKIGDRRVLLEDALKDAKSFQGELQDMLQRLADIDADLAATRPIGGLPETAQRQLDEFTELERAMDDYEPKINSLLVNGQSLVDKTPEVTTSGLHQGLANLRQRHDNIRAACAGRRTKLTDALKQAEEFQEGLSGLADWLTKMEKRMDGLKPVSRIFDTISEQIAEHEVRLSVF